MYVWVYLAFVNVLAFIMMGTDKRKAKKHKQRIPERTLWLTGIIGGSAGALAGMKIFRHKTKHYSFVIGMPVLILIHIILIAAIVIRMS
ncbi:DUF1294 domain-containing protein [Virgibacillus siamensis]|uniref:DUF1294 domain-containing protein n=1 Tax=Virgibacillus siamensis TaxID=480071 RepID=UPI000984C36C|nr:DUF1294 domain-containing protein [Virgibacillus siamensis]